MFAHYNHKPFPKGKTMNAINRHAHKKIVRIVKAMSERSREILRTKLTEVQETYPKTNFYFVKRISLYRSLLKTGKVPEGLAFKNCWRDTKLNRNRLLEELNTVIEIFLAKTAKV